MAPVDLAQLVLDTYVDTPPARRPTATAHAAVQVWERRWRELGQVAGRLDELSDKAANTRRWSPYFNLLGLVGEEVYAHVAGLPFDPWAKLRKIEARVAQGLGMSDGGEDFPGVDVKASSLTPPLLMHRRPRTGLAYALVAVDLPRRQGRYVGWASADELAATELRDFRGLGPTHRLPPERLRFGFPPDRPGDGLAC